MKIIFISSGNQNNACSPIIKAQGESLKCQHLEIDYYLIKGKGVIGYLKNIIHFRRLLSAKKYDIIHAHYGLAGIVALLAKKKQKLVVSFMGDDLVGSNRPNGTVTNLSIVLAKLNSYLAKKYYHFSIVKSKEMLNKIHSKNVQLIPNGVNISVFTPIDKLIARQILKINPYKVQIIFVSNPERAEKNFRLVIEALLIIDNPDIELITVFQKCQIELVNYYNSADLLVLTSFHEGSPNIIKEAMACNCPIVSTDVGDIPWLFGKTEGHFLASFDPNDFADKIKQAIEFSQKYCKTNGRQRIIDLGLESENVANKLVEVYRNLIN